jgi:hypothetical protein
MEQNYIEEFSVVRLQDVVFDKTTVLIIKAVGTSDLT